MKQWALAMLALCLAACGGGSECQPSTATAEDYAAYMRAQQRGDTAEINAALARLAASEGECDGR